MKIFTLDLSNTKSAALFNEKGIPLTLKIRRGIYGHDFDVLQGLMDLKHEEALIRYATELAEERGIATRDDWPVGFDIERLPVGAVITVVEE